MTHLSEENFQKGLLVDDRVMGGVSEDPERPGSYLAFVIEHTTGEYLGYHRFPSLPLALDALNRIPRSWRYEATGGCGKGSCGKKAADGTCDPSGCCSAGLCGRS